MKHRALVTGASRGIGKAIAENLRRSNVEVLTPTRAELDLSETESVKKFLKTAPSVDILINNAGENIINPLPSIRLEDWERMLTINLTSSFLLIQGLSKGMQDRKYGRIINISSVYSMISRVGRAAYTASKAGLNGLTTTAAIELGGDGILVNAVCPGFVETDLTRKNNTQEQLTVLSGQTALKRLAAPEEIAELVGFLASDRNTFLTGQCIVADGGFSLM